MTKVADMTSGETIWINRNGAVSHAGGQIRRTVTIAWVMAKSDLKQRYMGSILGAFWTLIRPLLLFAVLYIVFSHIVRMGGAIYRYPMYLLLSLTVWGLFADLTSSGVGCLVHREGIIRKIRIPMLSIPLASLIEALVQFTASMVIWLGFAIASGIRPTATWLLAPFLLVFVAIVSFGVALGLSVLFVRFRDVGPIWEVAVQVLFWATPVIYVSTYPPQPLRDILGLNPLAPVLTELRRWLIDPSAPGVRDVFATWSIVGSVTVAVLVVVVGVVAFQKDAPRAAERI
jgi:ABC-2 type transport system permease protein